MKQSDASARYNGIISDELMQRYDYIRRCHRVRSYSFGTGNSRKDQQQSTDADGHELSSPETIAKIVQTGFSR